MTPRFRLEVSTDATVPLRFDDAEFLEALVADATDDTLAPAMGAPRRGPLATLAGVRDIRDFDFSGFVDDGWVLHARRSITGDEEDALANAGQRQGGGLDVAAYNRAWWATWVRRVSLDAADEVDGGTQRALAKLSSPNSRARQDAFGGLPVETRDGFMVRLRAHVDAASRPADRDPGKAERPTAEPPLVIQAS